MTWHYQLVRIQGTSEPYYELREDYGKYGRTDAVDVGGDSPEEITEMLHQMLVDIQEYGVVDEVSI